MSMRLRYADPADQSDQRSSQQRLGNTTICLYVSAVVDGGSPVFWWVERAARSHSMSRVVNGGVRFRSEIAPVGIELEQIALSDPRTLGGLTQFRLLARRVGQETIGTTGYAESDMREGGFCARLSRTVRNSLILKRRDGGVVDRARLENVSVLARCQN
jgi:hypothetical protein